jgi:hypothetical protein
MELLNPVPNIKVQSDVRKKIRYQNEKLNVGYRQYKIQHGCPPMECTDM